MEITAPKPGFSRGAIERDTPRPRMREARPCTHPVDGLQRVVIENVRPQIDAGNFAIKRVIGENVTVRADIFADGHDLLSAVIQYRHEQESQWSEIPMDLLNNDRWSGSFMVDRLGTYFYTVEGWVNHFRSWRRDLEKKFAARLNVALELENGQALLEEGLLNAQGYAYAEIERALESLGPQSPLPLAAKVAVVLADSVASAMDAAAPRGAVTRFERELPVNVDPPLARFGAWYELFPRSCAARPGHHGTLQDCAAWLPQIAAMGFDVVYLPPIHPIGSAFRKGRNNQLSPSADDPGSPWAIGSREGGHKSIHPQLGTLADFRALVRKAKELGLEIALDIAFQCSPDHPYVSEHPQWFKHRSDGSIQYAENPPKKYQDIYPLDFQCADWAALWEELKSVFDFWIEQGIVVFRVDNPHTKSFRFWQWCLHELKSRNPQLIFLSEAFTRPKVMYHLAKLGFTQSYNYFPWRNTRHELTDYFSELARSGAREFFRPNLWPNTPDILPEYLQYGGPSAFVVRLILAATLGASYGIYGPPFERCENSPREPGSEEYLNSEKYEIRHWATAESSQMRELITRLNAIRRQNPALQSDDSLEFHDVDNQQIIAYSKHTPQLDNVVLTVVNLDPRHTHRGWLRLNTRRWGSEPTVTYQAHELLTNERYLWSGERHFIELNPVFVPAHVFLLKRYVRTEHDFDYFI